MFTRNSKPLTMKLMTMEYNKLVNASNIQNISRYSINRIFKNEDPEMKDMFLHNVISAWVKNQADHNDDFFRIFKKILRRTKISLTLLEKHDILLLEERAFSKERHIKIIDVTAKLLPKEIVGIKYVNAKLFIYNKEKLKIMKKGDLLISNKRIILDSSEEKSFEFSKIKWYKYKHYGFEFQVGTNIYVIRIHDQITLNNTIENIINKKVKNAIKKRKDN